MAFIGLAAFAFVLDSLLFMTWSRTIYNSFIGSSMAFLGQGCLGAHEACMQIAYRHAVTVLLYTTQVQATAKDYDTAWRLNEISILHPHINVLILLSVVLAIVGVWTRALAALIQSEARSTCAGFLLQGQRGASNC